MGCTEVIKKGHPAILPAGGWHSGGDGGWQILGTENE